MMRPLQRRESPILTLLFPLSLPSEYRSARDPTACRAMIRTPCTRDFSPPPVSIRKGQEKAVAKVEPLSQDLECSRSYLPFPSFPSPPFAMSGIHLPALFPSFPPPSLFFRASFASAFHRPRYSITMKAASFLLADVIKTAVPSLLLSPPPLLFFLPANSSDKNLRADKRRSRVSLLVSPPFGLVGEGPPDREIRSFLPFSAG